MSTVTPLIGIAAFPIAFGSAAVAYVSSGSPISVLIAILATLALAAVIWIVIRGRPAWRQSLDPTNTFVLALLIAGIGTMLLIGGIAALSLPAIGFGVVVLGVAWYIARPYLSAQR